MQLLSVYVCGRNSNMPKEQVNIDKILDNIFSRKAKTRKAMTMPPVVAKAVMRKYSVYLPKPPPPKLRKRHRLPKEEEKEENEGGRMPDPKPSRDWFPNRDYQEDDQSDMANMDASYEDGTQWEMEAAGKEISAMKEENETMNDSQVEGPEGQDQQEQVEWEGAEWLDEEEVDEWNQGDPVNNQEGQFQEEPDGMEWETGEKEEGGNQYGEEMEEEMGYQTENQDEIEDTTEPVPAPVLKPAQNINPSFIPLNMGVGKGGQAIAVSGAAKGYHTPLTRPVVTQNPLIAGKGWVHPIQDPMHPVHIGKGWIDTSLQMSSPPMLKGGWVPPSPPPYPQQYPPVPKGVWVPPQQYPSNYQGYQGFEHVVQQATRAAMMMPPGWTYHPRGCPSGKARAPNWTTLPDPGYDASGESEASPQHPALLKGKGKGKGKARKSRLD